MSLRVLLVEDNRLNAELAQLVLEMEGYRVVHATDAAGLRRRIAAETFDVVLLDIDLPDANGVELLAELRRSRPGLTVVAVTAHALLSDLDRFREAGFDAVITKPIDTRSFAAEVGAAVTRTKGQAERRVGSPGADDE